VACRQKFLGDLFLLFGCPVIDAVARPDGSLCIKFNEKQAMMLNVAEGDMVADDWAWRVESVKEDESENVHSVSCVMVLTNNRRDISFLIK
jgi:hypothetical protein